MTNRTAETSPVMYAKIAGFGYLVVFILGIFGVIAEGLIVPGDAATTRQLTIFFSATTNSSFPEMYCRKKLGFAFLGGIDRILTEGTSLAQKILVVILRNIPY